MDTPNGIAPSPTKEPVESWTWWAGALLILLVYYLVMPVVFPELEQHVDVSYTFFKEQAQAGNVVEVTSRGDVIQGTLKQPVAYPAGGAPETHSMKDFVTVRPAFADSGLEAMLRGQGIVINARPLVEPRGGLLGLLLSFGPMLLLIVGFLWLASRAQGEMEGVFGLGRSKAKRFDQSAEGGRRVTFADVAGIDESEDQLVEIVDFLKDSGKYTRLGGTAPKGVLLVGAPGTGKTLLARAVAGEAGVPFFCMGAAEFVEMFVGVGASRVRDLFKQAREAAPAIIFVDELDAIGRARADMAIGGHDEREQTLNQILTEMDGFSSREGVIVLAATNRPDVLDPALLRPGRFDRRMVMQPPDSGGREAILSVHTREVPLAADVDLKEIAGATPGLVGAGLRNLVNEAALLAARRNEDAVHQRDFFDALEKLVLGPARAIVMSSGERERVAYHEGGHAILGVLVPEADPVNRVSIVPRDQALGVTYQRPEADRYTYSGGSLRARIIGALGGRAAEEIVYGTRTTGAEGDLQLVTDLARQMVTRWGMSEPLGPVSLAPRDGSFLGTPEPFGFGGGGKPYSESTAELIDAEIRRIVDECYREAVRLLNAHRYELEALTQALLAHETLNERELLVVTGLTRVVQREEGQRPPAPAATK